MDLIREEMLIGTEATEKLKSVHVAVFGLGGVGGYVVEALARAGVGKLTVVDDDVIVTSNVNRQIYATSLTVGQAKAELAAKRIAEINPDCNVVPLVMRFDAQTVSQFNFAEFDYVVDAIDSVTSKLLLAVTCNQVGTPIISCMGTGNKLHPEEFQVADIYSTSVCPLAKVMRKELKVRGIKKLKVVYSKELPQTPKFMQPTPGKRQTPASISFVPPVAGFIAAGEVVRDLLQLD